MTVPISNLTSTWASTTATYNALKINVQSPGIEYRNSLTYQLNSRVVKYTLNSNTIYSIDVGGNIFYGGTLYMNQTGANTVANLGGAYNEGIGTRKFVTDSTSLNFGSVVQGGGANCVPVYSNGTHWLIG